MPGKRVTIAENRDETAVAVDKERAPRIAIVGGILRPVPTQVPVNRSRSDSNAFTAHSELLGYHVAATSAHDKAPPPSFQRVFHHFIVVFVAAFICWAASIATLDQFADRDASDLPVLTWNLNASGTGPGPADGTATDAVKRMAKIKFMMIMLEAVVATGAIAVALEMVMQTVYRTFASTHPDAAAVHGLTAEPPARRGAAVFIALAIVLQRLRHAVPSALNPHIVVATDMMLLDMVVFMMFGAAQACLISIQTSVESFAETADLAVKFSPPVTKWREISRNFCKFEDPVKQDAYSFHVGVAITPARVLAEICVLYVLLAKGIALVILIFHFVGVDLYENIVILSVRMRNLLSSLGASTLTIPVMNIVSSLLCVAWRAPWPCVLNLSSVIRARRFRTEFESLATTCSTFRPLLLEPRS